MNNNYIEDSKFEHRFWLQILGDHSRFIFNTLSPTEGALINTAQNFIKIFDDLLEKARGEMDAEAWQGLAREAQNAAQSLRDFKSISPLIPDHMAREECYYLHRLSKSDPTNVPEPACDPDRPRIIS